MNKKSTEGRVAGGGACRWWVYGHKWFYTKELLVRLGGRVNV